MASCNSQKETDSMSIAERNSLSRKDTVYHGKKQSIKERNSLSRKETVYHRKKMSACFNQAYSNSITKADKYSVFK